MTDEQILIKITKSNGQSFYKLCTDNEADEISESYNYDVIVVGEKQEIPSQVEIFSK